MVVQRPIPSIVRFVSDQSLGMLSRIFYNQYVFVEKYIKSTIDLNIGIRLLAKIQCVLSVFTNMNLDSTTFSNN